MPHLCWLKGRAFFVHQSPNNELLSRRAVMKTALTNLIFVLLLWFGCGVGPSLNCPPECGCEDKENGFLVNCANKGFESPINPNDLPANTFEL